MCVVSMIADDFTKRIPQVAPWVVPMDWGQYTTSTTEPPKTVTREEFEKLEREMREMIELLKAAKKYDAATGQPDCEWGLGAECLV